MPPIRPDTKSSVPSQRRLSSNAGVRWLESDFQGAPQVVAKRLLGAQLVRLIGSQRLSGIIVEVEAYLAVGDAASHSAKGCRKRNAAMFQSAGSLYVYTIHTRHCLNVVTEAIGVGSAVLIRAIEPLDGLEMMRRFRHRPLAAGAQWSSGDIRQLTSGPGRICEALGVDLALDGQCLVSGDQIWIESPPPCVQNQLPHIAVVNSPRIGITRDAYLPLRWFLEGHQLVSGRARDHVGGRTWRFNS